MITGVDALTGFMTEPFPPRPYFSCGSSEFLIIDQKNVQSILKGDAEPWLRLTTGPDNVMESPPVKVLDHDGWNLRLQCRDAVLKFDFDAESAFKILPDGSQFVYRAGLDEANAGRGWMPVS